MIRRIRRWFRDLFLHLGPGLLCHIVGSHRDLVPVAVISKKGFRGVDLLQCRKCLQFYVPDATAKRLGGRAA